MPNPKKIAVSGSSGFVGTRLVTALKDRGYEVIRLLHASKRALQPDELIWNSESGLAKPQELNGVGAIIHLAGRNIAAARWSESEKNRIYDSRVTATKQLVKQILTLEDRPTVFLAASAVGIYGECGEQTVDETQPPGTDFLSEVAKDWEAAASPLLEAGVRVANARLGVVLDPSEGALAKMLPLFRWGLGGRLGSGKQYWSWVAIEDVIAGLCWLLENAQATGPYNLVSPQTMTNSEFTTKLANAIGRPAVFPAPKFALRLALGEMADALLLTSCRAVPKKLLSEGFQFQYPDLSMCLEKQLLKL
jgi:uncharacterized protein